uniref:Polypeptide N-acetylgalactosaminyltransferase n=1 Tax=Ornithodoros turicata TaxID=34597 RepID=A0A2R5LLE0_9ACAR
MGIIFARRRRTTLFRLCILLCGAGFVLLLFRQRSVTNHYELYDGPAKPIIGSDSGVSVAKPRERGTCILNVDDPDEEQFFKRQNASWGAGGDAVQLSGTEKEIADRQFKKAGFSVYISDRMPLNRTIGDRRHRTCHSLVYPDDLPTASVVIIFTDEIFSALIRTIYTVLLRSPPHLLKEIILVDDASTIDELAGKRLDRFIERHFCKGLVKLIHLNERQGLIRARLAGARIATGDVLVFLDSHCEATDRWLEALLQPIKDSRTTVVCPIIDVIDDKSLQYMGTSADFFQLGGFNWRGEFIWINIPTEWKRARKSKADPVRTPTMAGGLFAIDRSYFWESGSYDAEMDGWGGENLEMSFRIWMCGGQIVIAPCSHVGHIFRDFHPYKFPNNKDTHAINTARLAEVWMDRYKVYFYQNRPELKRLNHGDISKRKALREGLRCKDFKWYLTHVYPNKFVPDEDVLAHGYVRNPWSNICLDSMGRSYDNTEPLGLYPCQTSGDGSSNQVFSYTSKRQIRKEDSCAQLEADKTKSGGQTVYKVMMASCSEEPDMDQEWEHTRGGELRSSRHGLCLEAKQTEQDGMVARPCRKSHAQVWWFSHYKEPQVEVVRL